MPYICVMYQKPPAFQSKKYSQNLPSCLRQRAIDRLVTDGLAFNNAKEYRFVNPFFREWIKRIA